MSAPPGLAEWIASTAPPTAAPVAAAAASVPVPDAVGTAEEAVKALETQREATALDMFDEAGASVTAAVGRLVPATPGGATFDLTVSDAVFKLGRSKDLPQAQRLDCSRLSGTHCELRVDPDTFAVTLFDRSTNGTWHNGARLAKDAATPLAAGDSVQFVNPALPQMGQSFEYLFQQLRAIKQPAPAPAKAPVDPNAPGQDQTSLAVVQSQSGTALDEALLTCSVCQSLFHKPASVMPCLHVFCGHCITSWLNNSRDCPECRAVIREVRPNAKMGSLVEECLKARPLLQRSATELAAIAQLATVPPGGVKPKRPRDDDGAADDDDEGEEEEESDWSGSDSDGSAPFAPPSAPLFGFQPGHYAHSHFVAPAATPMAFGAAPSSCVQCTAPSADGFQCPPNGNHCQCYLCKRPFPDRPLLKETPQRCELCNKAFCDLYLGGCAHPQGVGFLQPVADHDAATLPQLAFGGNSIEQGILARYIAAAGITPQQAWATCIQKFKDGTWVPDITNVQGQLTAQSVVCRPCSSRVFAALLYHFRRSIPKDALPPAVVARPDCWYGLGCRTQQHNLQHSQNYNHVCPNVKRKE